MTDIARLRELADKLRENATWEGEWLDQAADAIDYLSTELETLRAREGEMRKALEKFNAWLGSRRPDGEHGIGGNWEDWVPIEMLDAYEPVERALLTPTSPGDG